MNEGDDRAVALTLHVTPEDGARVARALLREARSRRRRAKAGRYRMPPGMPDRNVTSAETLEGFAEQIASQLPERHARWARAMRGEPAEAKVRAEEAAKQAA